jgi:acylglycerol lipase
MSPAEVPAEMDYKEGTFKGRDDLDLFYRCWLPVKSPKAVLVIAHGLAEHSGRYRNLAEFFTGRGYAVYGLDLPGHGRSEGSRCYINRFSDYTEDVGSFLDLVRNEGREGKIFLLGHSMGGTIAVDFAVGYQDELTGMLISAAVMKVGYSVTPFQVMAAGILSRLVPKMGVSVLDATAISKDPAVVDAYVNDPLVYRGKIRARTGAELIRTIGELSTRLPEIRLPVLIMHGTEDRLSEPEGSRMLYEKLGSADKTLKMYEGLYHEIFNEPEREQVMADAASWIAAHL